MRKLPVDFFKAAYIKEKCEAQHELVRVAAEKLRNAKRRVDAAQIEIDRFSGDYGPEIGHHERGTQLRRGEAFQPGLAAHNMRSQELHDAQEMHMVAGSRYQIATTEAAYWGGLRSQVIEYLRSRFTDAQLPVEFRSSEEN